MADGSTLATRRSPATCGVRAQARIRQVTRMLHVTSVAIARDAVVTEDVAVLFELGRDLLGRVLQGARGDNGGGMSVISEKARVELTFWSGELLLAAKALVEPIDALPVIEKAIGDLAPFTLEA